MKTSRVRTARGQGFTPAIQVAIEAKIAAKERRERFEEWRHEVALDAANEAFNAAAGRRQ
eukprot:2456564-Amphidinium_carterae.1